MNSITIRGANRYANMAMTATVIYMHTTTAQNANHRTDIAWMKSKGKSFEAAGERFISEYVNHFTGQAIRKSWRMTGVDWFIFSAEGVVTGRAHSLTVAKYDAAEA